MLWLNFVLFEPMHSKTYKITCTRAQSNQVFAGHSVDSQGPSASSRGQQRLLLDYTKAQTDLRLRRIHMPFCRLCCARPILSWFFVFFFFLQYSHIACNLLFEYFIVEQ